MSIHEYITVGASQHRISLLGTIPKLIPVLLIDDVGVVLVRRPATPLGIILACNCLFQLYSVGDSAHNYIELDIDSKILIINFPQQNNKMVPTYNLSRLINESSSSPEDLKKIANMIGLNMDYSGSIYRLPRVLGDGNYIMLLTPGPNVYNGHWVAMKIMNGNGLYFDAYGVPPPQYLVDLVNLNNINSLGYSTCQIQDMRSAHCGDYCLAWLDAINGKRSCPEMLHAHYDFINMFHEYNNIEHAHFARKKEARPSKRARHTP